MEPKFSDSSSEPANEQFWKLAESSSDEEVNQLIQIIVDEQQENGRNKCRGSVPGRKFTERYRFQIHQILFRDYFAENPVHKDDSAGRLGLSSLQKATAAMRMLAYGHSANSVNDYVRIGESTAIEALRRFVQAIIEYSPLFADLRKGQAPPINYNINNHDYTMGYYLADGIYASWATFVKSIPQPQGEKAKNFAKAQDGCRKDVERAFGVL
ncbi:uncharacterized protein LOC126787110 [Argentina anserina]|uniref:uncharacterized protein LOC126787110 n=1 Tax=Argentina anserina TaxID=57926 RepID=UPI0021768478|nr:uncharacterized protein LOC126787110 [Potentilla anserina]